MHHGEFWGNGADKRAERILILGESHHISTNPEVTTDKVAGFPASYTTASVVQEHLDGRKTHGFLNKIAETFGVTNDGQHAFWQRVYFGNYVDVLCDIGNSVAMQQIKREGNRKRLNNQLFQFVNEHNISKIFCFSILAYKNLPKLADNEESARETIGVRGNRRVYLRQCQYKAGVEHDETDVILQQNLEIYGISHPSARGGYCPEMYAQKLSSKI